MAGTAAETLDTARPRTESAARMAATVNQGTRVNWSMGLLSAVLILGAELMLVGIWEPRVLLRVLLRWRRLPFTRLLPHTRIRLRRVIPTQSYSSTTRPTTGE